MIGNDKTSFPHKLLLPDGETANICKTFGNHSSINVKLSKTKISKIFHSGVFVRKPL